MSYWNNNFNNKKDIKFSFKEGDGKEYYLDSNKSISQALFTFRDYDLNYMTEYLELKYFGTKYKKDDLVCPLVDPSVSLEGCCFAEARKKKRQEKLEAKKAAKAKDESDDDSSSDDEVEEDDDPHECWCQFIYDMINSEKAEATTRIFLPSAAYSYQSYGYVVEVEGRFQKEKGDTSSGYIPTVQYRKKKWKEMIIYYEVGFEYYSPGTNTKKHKKHFVSLRYVDQNNKKVKIKSDDHSISTVKFKLALSEIPKNFCIKMGSQSYETTPNVSCNQGDGHLKNPCRPKTGLCWCSVVNMLRSKGEGFMTIPMNSTGKTTTYFDYTMNFKAVRDKNDRHLINIEIDFDGKYRQTTYKYTSTPTYTNNYYRNGYESPDDEYYYGYSGHGHSNYRGW